MQFLNQHIGPLLQNTRNAQNISYVGYSTSTFICILHWLATRLEEEEETVFVNVIVLNSRCSLAQ